MSVQLLKKQEVGTWSETFPEEMNTFKQSLIFMKRLLGVAICNITYLRLMFPDDAYVNKSLEGIHLKVLKNSEKYPQVNSLIQCLKGVFESLEKKYLKTLVFLIHPDPNDLSVVMESYSFAFLYNTDTEISIFNKKEKVASVKCGRKTKAATISLIRKLILLCSTLKPLPDVFSISMKLFYYDEVTPIDYEPSGFNASDEHDNAKNDATSKLFDVGEIDTLYHTCTLQLCTKKDEYDDNDVPPTNLSFNQQHETTSGGEETTETTTSTTTTTTSVVDDVDVSEKENDDGNVVEGHLNGINENISKLDIREVDSLKNKSEISYKMGSQTKISTHNNNINNKINNMRSPIKSDSIVPASQHTQRTSRKKKFVQTTEATENLARDDSIEPERKRKVRKLSRSKKIDIDVVKSSSSVHSKRNSRRSAN